jgi:hypothetical protein
MRTVATSSIPGLTCFLEGSATNVTVSSAGLDATPLEEAGIRLEREPAGDVHGA